MSSTYRRGPGADERQTDGSPRRRHRGGDRPLDHRRHPEEASRVPSNWPNCDMGAVITARRRLPLRWKERGGPSISSSCGRRAACTGSIMGRSPSATSRLKPNWRSSRTGAGEKTRTGKPRTPWPQKAMTSASRRQARCSRHCGREGCAEIQGIDVPERPWSFWPKSAWTSVASRRKSTLRVGCVCVPRRMRAQHRPKRRRGHRKGKNRIAIALRMARTVGGQNNDAVGYVLPADPQSNRWTPEPSKATTLWRWRVWCTECSSMARNT